MLNRDILEGNWKQLKGKVKQQWGKLSDDELDRMDGSAEELAGLIQKHYGHTREEARKEIDSWARRH